jgi:glucose/arabinose dehydrogenase
VTFGAIGGLNHGIAFSPDGAWLYVSTPTDVYRWAYARGQRAASSPPERVVRGIPGGGHSTRTLLFDREGRLYVSVGSATNLDQTSSDLALRSMIRRFAIPATLPAGGLAYDAGEVVASGMRNEVGLTIDSSGRMWGVENGRDNLGDARFVGDIHMDNPAEELNRIDGPGPTFFGYPFCWTEGMVTGGGGAGTQHGDVEVTASLRRDDAWCQNAANVRRPAGVMPAHWAPLGVTEYTGSVLPANWRGDLFITSHGSWNREAGQTGRLIARADVQADGTVSGIQPVVGQRDSNGNLVQGVWGVRPVDIRTGPDGALYFTDDLGGRVLRIGYR